MIIFKKLINENKASLFVNNTNNIIDNLNSSKIVKGNLNKADEKNYTEKIKSKYIV